MRIYDLAHRQETENENRYDYEFILHDVGKGQLVRQLERMDSHILYQFVVFERREETGEILDHQNADEWLHDYRESFARSGGLQVGDLVVGVLKSRPLYQVVKIFTGGSIWIRPVANEDGDNPGAVQKGVRWFQVVKY